MKSETVKTGSDIRQIAELTPFEVKDLAGQKFLKKGNMLGGASPVVESVPSKND